MSVVGAAAGAGAGAGAGVEACMSRMFIVTSRAIDAVSLMNSMIERMSKSGTAGRSEGADAGAGTDSSSDEGMIVNGM